MARMISETIKITVSKLVKDTDPTSSILSEDTKMALEEVTKELTGNEALVEVDTE
jgi:hypothetical protein